MRNIAVIDKVSLDKVNIEGNIIILDKVSIVQTKIKKEDILETIQEGNNLIIKLKNGETITIENYFVKNENGEASDVVFEDSEYAFLLLVWDNGVAGFKELTGLEELLPITAGGSTAAIPSLPWIVGGVAGGIIAGVSGGGSDSSEETPVQPTVPEILDAPKIEIATDQNNDEFLNAAEVATDSQISVVVTMPQGTEIGDKIVVKDQNEKLYEHVLTKENIEQGQVAIDVDRPVEGSVLNVQAYIENAGGKSALSEADQALIDTTAPQVKVDITADYQAGTATTLFTFTEKISGFDESDLTVVGGEIVAGSLHQNTDGTWTATVTGIEQGTPVIVTVKPESYADLAGNAGTQGSAEDISVKIEAVYPTENAGSTVSGTTKPGNEVSLKIPNSDQVYTGTADENGQWTIHTDSPLQDGEKLTVTTPNNDKAPAQDEQPLPFVSIDPIAENDFIREDDLDSLVDENGLVSITGKVSNPSADMSVTFNGKVYSGDQVSISPNGTWEIKVPVADVDVNGQNNITAQGVVTDAQGTQFPSNEANRDVASDTTPPTVQVSIDLQGQITLQYDADVDPKSIQIDQVTVIDQDGQPINVSFTPSADGLTFTAQLPSNIQENVTVTEQSYQDIHGNQGERGTDLASIDTQAPSLEIDLKSDGTVLFTFSENVKGFTSADVLVNGAHLVAGSLTDLGQGVWTAQLDKMPKDGTTVTVEVKDDTYTDLAGNLGKGDLDQEIHIKVNTVTPNPQTNGTIITGKTEPNQSVDFAVPGYDQLFKVTTDSKGNWVVETDQPIKDGNSITATAPDQDGNPIADQVQLPYVSIDFIAGDDVLDPSELIEIKTGTTLTVTGTISNPTADMTVTFNGKSYSGSQVTVNTDGTWSIQVPVEDIQSQNTVTAQATATAPDGTTVDSAPAIREPMTSGSITVDVDDQGHIIGQTTEVAVGQSVELILIGYDKNHVEIEVKITTTVKADGTYEAQVPSELKDGDIQVFASSIDPNQHPLNSSDTEGTLNRTSPTVDIEISPNGEITVTFDPDVDPNTIDPTQDIVITDKGGNPITVAFTPSEDGLTFVAKVPETVEGNVTVKVPEGSYTDTSGNPGTPNQETTAINMLPPTVEVAITPNGEITVTFDPDVDPNSIDPKTDIVITDKDGNPITVVFTPSEDGLTFVAKVPETVEGKVTVAVPEGSYTDTSGNSGTPNQETTAINMVPPTVVVTINSYNSVTFTFDEPIQDFDASDIVVTGGQLKPGTLVDNNDGTWTAELQNTVFGQTITVAVKDQSYSDLSDNLGTAGVDTEISIKITSVVPVDGSNDKVVTGLTEPNQDVTVTFPNGDTHTVRSNGQGVWTLTTEIIEAVNDQILATTVDEDGGIVADIISLPFVSIDVVAQDNAINETEFADLASTVTLTGKVSNPDVTMTVTVAGTTYTGTQVTVNANGTWSVDVPKADIAQDFEVTALATSNASGVTLDEASRDVTVDLVAPAVVLNIDETGYITLSYDADVDPSTIDLTQVQVMDSLGQLIPVSWNTTDINALNFSAMIDLPVDDVVTVTVLKDSYQDYVGNQGLSNSDAQDIDNAAPDIQPTVVTTDEDTFVVMTWADFGISDQSTDASKLVVSITQLPTEGLLYLNGQAVTDVATVAGLSKADIDAGQLSFKADANKASSSIDTPYADLTFSVTDAVNASTGSVDFVVNAVADKPNLTVDVLDWAPTAVNLNIQTWTDLKTVTIDGQSYNLLQGNGSGMPAATLKTVFEYLNSTNNTAYPATTTGETSVLVDTNVPAYKGIAITGYVYLEAGHRYNYTGKADDSGMLIVGNEDPVFVSYGGLSTSTDYSFDVFESGFYTFDFYMHNQSGAGNYNFQVIDEAGDQLSYYASLEDAVSSLNDFYQESNSSVEWKLSNLIQSNAADQDQNGFYRPYFNVSGEVGQDISLGLLNSSLNDLDGSESLTLNFSGLIEGMTLYALDSDGSRILLGTADANG